MMFLYIILQKSSLLTCCNSMDTFRIWTQLYAYEHV